MKFKLPRTEAAGGSQLFLLVLGLVDGGPWGTLRRRSLGPAHYRIESIAGPETRRLELWRRIIAAAPPQDVGRDAAHVAGEVQLA